MLRKLLLCLLASLVVCSGAKAQPLNEWSVDSIVNKALAVFHTPGIAVSIVQDGRVLLSKGYGYRSLGPQKRADQNTLFGIASNSKAFTAAALAILVDEGKLKWDDKLVRYIPEFRMYEPYVTREFTIADMLSHRSGLGVGAGDLLHNPDSTDFTVSDVIRSLRYLKPEASFRSGYAYDNIFYLVAAELIHRVSGENWGDFIQRHIFRPLHMDRSGASYVRVKADPNVIEGYDELNGTLTKIARDDAEQDSGAGGIYASADDMGRWMLVQLNNGRYGPDLKAQLFSGKAQEEMWTPRIFIPVSKTDGYDSHFGAYALGWFLVDAKGYQVVSHTGQDDGMISEVVLVPELHAGITVMSNRDVGGAVRAIIDQLTDYLLNVKGKDRTAYWKAKVDARSHGAATNDQTMVQQISHARVSVAHILKLCGTYRDNWFGDVIIYGQKGKLYFRSERSKQLRGELFPYKSNAWLVKWTNRNLQADAFIKFNGKGFRMERALPETSAAYDFQDLDFKKVK